MSIEIILAILVSLVVVRLLLNALTPGLTHVPGPWLAKFTNGWRLYEMYRARHPKTLQQLHEQYGPIVRIGPNVVDVSDPAFIEPIYGVKSDFIKSDKQKAGQVVVNGKLLAGIVDTQDKKYHAQLKRPIAGIYSMSNVQTSEPLIDNTIKYFFKRLNEEYINKRSCDIASWLQYFAFDVIAELTFSSRIGFLENGGDVDSILVSLESEFNYRAFVGQMPWIARFLKQNPLYLFFAKPSNALATKTMMLLDQREEKPSESIRRDMYGRFVESQKTHPETVTDRTLLRYTMTNVNAASDTTAVVLRSIIYYTLRHPHVLAKLHNELESASLVYPADFRTVQGLPYLDAVIREGFRIHPVVASNAERIVGQGGLSLMDGRKLPQGTVVGMFGWGIHWTKAVFGEDCNEFKPERWLKYDNESEDAYNERLSAMKKADFTFGYGPRSCLGKHVAQMEVYKLAATLFGCLDMELTHPEREWKVEARFFTKQSDMDISIKWREGVDVEKMTAAE